jgi:3'-(hydroxy)phthioceranyl-2'-palmitoyl(stearoyl)-2-O-sulfo-trehalose (hydroxy)phthioceranyltransferase
MGNLLADLNAVAGAGYYGHSATAFSDPAHVAPGDITTTINDKGATTTTYLIRSNELPLVRALVDMAGLPPEAAGPLNAVLKPMVDRAYGPPRAPLPNAGDLGPGVRQVRGIAPAISIPIESTNAGITATNVANVANAGKVSKGS